MKVLLVNPSITGQIRFPGTVDINSRQHDLSPPLGLMYLKSFLEKHSSHEVRIFNFQVPSRPGPAEFERVLREFRPDAVGIGIMSWFWYQGVQTAALVRLVLPEAKVITGGPHPTVLPRETLLRPEFDFAVAGEGEYPLLELLRRLEAGEDTAGIPGVVHRRDGEILVEPRGRPPRDLDQFPFPDRSDFNPRQYRPSAVSWAPSAVMIASRGCPHRCAFCSNYNRVYRVRDPEAVVDEMLVCREMGYNSIDFFDDNFNEKPEWVERLCRAMLDRRVGLPWGCRGRVDRIDRDLIALMAKAGCERINFGVESGSQWILDDIHKGITVDQVRKAFALAQEHKMIIVGYFIVGFPGETPEQARETIRLAMELNPDYMMLFPLIPVPGTEIYERAFKDPNFRDPFPEFIRNPWPDLVTPLWETAMTADQTLSLIRDAYLRFYFRPRFIWRAFRNLTSLEDFRAKARSALDILALR